MNDTLKSIGRMVMSERKKLGYTQEVLADFADVSRSTVQKIVNGDSVHSDSLARVMDVLKLLITTSSVEEYKKADACAMLFNQIVNSMSAAERTRFKNNIDYI